MRDAVTAVTTTPHHSAPPRNRVKSLLEYLDPITPQEPKITPQETSSAVLPEVMDRALDETPKGVADPETENTVIEEVTLPSASEGSVARPHGEDGKSHRILSSRPKPGELPTS